MAEEVGIHFIKVVPDDLASTMVHGTQEKIGEVFKNAERHAPAFLFFDEFDAMVPRRTGNEYNQHYDSEVNEFLCMLNHASDKGVYVLAATNHPECIDKAVLRTGRIDELVYVDMPDVDDDVEVGEVFGAVESVKAASDLLSPVSGTVVEVNESLEDSPELINQDANENWIIKVKLSDPSELESLMDEDTYNSKNQ